MTRTLSVSVTPEQYKIIKEIANSEKCSVSSILKDSIQICIVLKYMNEVVSKVGLEEKTIKTIERDAKIREHAKAIANLMQPILEKAVSGVNPDVIKALEDEGKEIENTIHLYNKTTKRGRRPELMVETMNGDK